MKESRFPLKLVMELLAAFSIVFSIIWQIRVDKRQNDWSRKSETLHALESRDRTLMKDIAPKIKGISNGDSLINLIGSDSALKSRVTQQLNIYEHIGIGEQIGIYDKLVIKKFLGESYSYFFYQLKPWIDYRRKESKKPTLLENYEFCVKDLEEN